MAKLIWTEPALHQLDEVAGYIALDKPEAARAMVQKVFELCAQLKKISALGKRFPEISHPNYRRIWVKPVWIYYRMESRRIYIPHIRRAEKRFDLDDII